jgi:hypothetical protein
VEARGIPDEVARAGEAAREAAVEGG